MKIRIIFLLSTILVSIGTVEAQVTEWEKGIIGKWTLTDSNDIESTFTRTEEFEMDKPGFAFFENGIFIFHVNADFCGTKPVTLSNLSGNWKKIQNEILGAEFKDWTGGLEEYKMFIKSVNENQLIIQFIQDVN